MAEEKPVVPKMDDKGEEIFWSSYDGGLTGKYCAIEDAKIRINDAGFGLGIALYDYLSMYRGWIRKVDSHIDRFYGSMHACKMDPEISKEKLTEQILEAVRRSKFQDCGISLIATWGAFPTLIDRSHQKLGGDDHKVTLMIRVIPYRWIFPPEYLNEGYRIIIPSNRAYPLQCINPRLKNFDRLNYFLAQLEAFNAGVDGFVCLTLDGHLAENYHCNIWLVKNGKLFTPSENTLQGITSECVHDMAAEMNIEATGAFLTAYDLYTADEAFFSTSAGPISPIVEVDARTIGNGKPGPITRRLFDAYWKLHVNPKYAVKVD